MDARNVDKVERPPQVNSVAVRLLTLKPDPFELMLGLLAIHYATVLLFVPPDVSPQFVGTLESFLPSMFWGCFAVVVGAAKIGLTIYCVFTSCSCYRARMWAAAAGFVFWSYLTFALVWEGSLFLFYKLFLGFALASAFSVLLLGVGERRDGDREP